MPITHLARFVTEADLEPTMVNLYGGRSWEPARKTTNLEARRQILQDAFRARLRESCQWVRWFEIVPEVGKNSYSLFFGTNSEMGLRRMKDAMWKIDPVQGTSFRDSTTVDHPVLFAHEPDLGRLEGLLQTQFKGSEFGIEKAVDFTLKETAFRDNGHLKPTLKAAEADERLVVTAAKATRRRGQFPDGTRMRFA